MKSVYVATRDLKVGMLVRVEHQVMIILPDLKGVCQDGYLLVEDIRTGKRHQQNASYVRPVKT